MQKIGAYLISVCAAAIVCGIFKSLLPEKSAAGAMLRLVCGIFLVFTAFRSMSGITVEELSLVSPGMAERGEELSSEGKDLAEEAMVDIIKDRTEAYILDKAHALNAELTVEVAVGGDPLSPISVKLVGSVSPYARSQLTAMLESELGIAKEAQQWTG